VRSAVKHALELLVRSAGLTRLGRRQHREQTLILAYHNIVPDGERVNGDKSLHLSQRDFARQLDLLATTHEIVPLSALHSGPGQTQPRVVITFDDAYKGALTAGVTELVKRGLPATVFVAPAFLGGASFWWDALAGDRGLDPKIRNVALHELGGADDRMRDWARTHQLPVLDVPAHQTAASEAELRAATETGLIALGSHTWSHPNLTVLADEHIEQQLADSVLWLRSRFSSVTSWISYPYGLSCARVERIAREVGYEGGFMIAGGWLSADAFRNRRFALPRLNVPAGISLTGFDLRVSGLLSH
jgi:peptidoglycan/xylan/chitin deacetylase (PgdA/CDA1 family)